MDVPDFCLLSGRWEVFLVNLHREWAQPFRACLEAIALAANDAERVRNRKSKKRHN